MTNYLDASGLIAGSKISHWRIDPPHARGAVPQLAVLLPTCLLSRWLLLLLSSGRILSVVFRVTAGIRDCRQLLFFLTSFSFVLELLFGCCSIFWNIDPQQKSEMKVSLKSWNRINFIQKDNSWMTSACVSVDYTLIQCRQHNMTAVAYILPLQRS